MQDKDIKSFRNFISWKIVEAAAAISLVIGLYLTMTNTINAHDDMLFAIGVFSLIALPIVVIWFVFFFFFSVKRYLSKSVQNSNINN